MDEKRRITDEKMKPMMSCTVEPGRMSTQKPTRNNCKKRWSGSQTWGQNLARHMAVRVVKGELRAFFPVSTISHQYIEGL